MNTNRKDEETGETNNNMCSASASADTVINKSTACVQSGLKYNCIHHLVIRGSFGPRGSTAQTTSQSVQLFLQGSQP